MNETRNPLGEKVRKGVCEVLYFRVADLLELALRAKQAHWNVRGKEFGVLHEVFGGVAEAAWGYADDVAERVVQLGGSVVGSVEGKKVEVGDGAPLGYVTGLVGDVVAFVRGTVTLAEAAGDQVTMNLLIDVQQGLEKWLWKLEASK